MAEEVPFFFLMVFFLAVVFLVFLVVLVFMVEEPLVDFFLVD